MLGRSERIMEAIVHIIKSSGGSSASFCGRRSSSCKVFVHEKEYLKEKRPTTGLGDTMKFCLKCLRAVPKD
jgi:hypothetical protein